MFPKAGRDQAGGGENRTRGSRSSRVAGACPLGEVEGPVPEPADGVGDVGRDGGQVVDVDSSPSPAISLAVSVMSQAVE